jgi:hypothetical protein
MKSFLISLFLLGAILNSAEAAKPRLCGGALGPIENALKELAHDSHTFHRHMLESGIRYLQGQAMMWNRPFDTDEFERHLHSVIRFEEQMEEFKKAIRSFYSSGQFTRTISIQDEERKFIDFLGNIREDWLFQSRSHSPTLDTGADHD